MFRTNFRAQRTRRSGFASSLALALVLAGGLAAPASAADKNKSAPEGKSQYTKPFVDAYKPLEDALNKATDAASAEAARPLVAPMVAAVSNDDERYAAGTLLLKLGLKLSDKEMQRQSLVLQLDSGKAPEANRAMFNYYVGGFSYDKGDFAGAAKYFTQAFDLGYRENNIASLVADAYFKQNNTAQGLAEIKRMEKVMEASGSQLPEETLRRGLKAVYDSGDTSQIADWTAMVVKHYPKPETWNMALTVVREGYRLQPEEALDLYRLMRLTGALLKQQDYLLYIEAADARRLPNEVAPVIQEGIAKGLLDAKDPGVAENLKVAQTNMGGDRAQADQMAQDARNAKDGVPARAAGDNFLALNQPQKAEEMYKLAAQKGGADTDRVTMRTGVAQAMAGEYADARSSFAKVTGRRAPAAEMWLAYLDTKQAPAATASASVSGTSASAQ